MDMEYNIGQTELATKVNGHLIKLRAKEHLNINKVTCTMVSLRMTRLMVTGNIFILMVQLIRDHLSMTFKRVRVKNNGLMEPSTKANTKVELSMDLGHIHGQMRIHIPEIGKTIKLEGMVSIVGRMVDHMMGTGKITI